MAVCLGFLLTLLVIPLYPGQSEQQKKEAALRDDLFTMRSLIQQYKFDKAKAPQSLDDLVRAGYLKQIPVDPFTRSRYSWIVDQEEDTPTIDPTQPGIADVHSGASPTSSVGTAYSTW